MVRHPLGWAAGSVMAAMAFLTALAWLLSPGQDTGLALSSLPSGDSVSAKRFAQSRTPVVSGLQQVSAVRMAVPSPAVGGPFGGAASIGTREASDPQQVNAAAMAEWAKSPRNVPSTVLLSNPAQPAFVSEPSVPASRNAGYVANYAPQAANGVATWYGGGFNGNVTYCGHIYDMYDPTTAASTDFPCGTWLTVTNVSNGAAIMVQVKDRGLLGPGHVDLSLAAFSAIASPGQGVIDISVSNRGLR